MTALTSREIAAMKALPAAIKAQNEAYTQGRLVVQVAAHEPAAYLVNDQRQAVARCINTNLQGRFEADARRLAACWNVCEGIPTETLESCAHWSDIVKAPMNHRQHIPAEAAAVGAVLDPESLEQGEPG